MPKEVRQAVDRLRRAEDVQHIALMPDVHLAGTVCIGTVLATNRVIYPQAVGADIGCGIAAVGFDCEASVLADERTARAVLTGLHEVVPVMRHRSRSTARPLPAALAEMQLSHPRLVSTAQHEGLIELGTLGRGNHFLELQADDDDRLWLMVHSGSRAMGQIITEWHMKSAKKTGGGLFYLEADSPEGKAYLGDVAWARAYADTNRRLIIDAVGQVLAKVLRARTVEDSLIHGDHNHVQQEEHFGVRLWIHRKGANPAAEGQPGIIPGSMGTRSLHVAGRGCSLSLCSSSHGAGRVMTRQEARQTIPVKRLMQELEGVWFDERVAASLREEAPSAYKDIDAVMRAQKELVRVVRRLRPVLCYKGV